tara:strand:+ start:2522 stop:3655 length:1134 start_codon:yes stop_codon:yes gene_type:complete
MKSKTIIHQVTFAAVGGIQSSFISLFSLLKNKSEFNHKIYGMHEVDTYYIQIKKYYTNFSKSLYEMIKFLFFLISKNYIIHLYNNLSSKRIYYLLRFLRCSNIIYHERGTSWNASKKDIKIIKKNAENADIIVANSEASKIILTKRFKVDKNKIKVIYNGVLSESFKNGNFKKYSDHFSIGFIGRLDTPKGVHILIDVAKKMKEIKFFIAGDGVLEKDLKIRANGYENINFMGRSNPIEFISKMDVIVVPSIREPLGNVIIESGFCSKPVIASKVDGIPEIITNNKNGILLNPKNEITFKSKQKNAVPVPDYVVNFETKELVKPKEIDQKDLIKAIYKLKNDDKLRLKLSKNLNQTVKKKFSLESYFYNIHEIYRMF